MIKTKLTATLGATAVAAGVVLSVATASPALAEGGCGAPSSLSGAHTATSRLLFGRTIELRGNTGTVCAWGRISNGSAGDKVWVNRSGSDLSNYPYSGAGQAFISSGKTSAYTPEAYNDNGTTMTACGKAGNRTDISCTDPY